MLPFVAQAAVELETGRLVSAATVVNDERVTSNFALAWTERRVGPTQSHRRFLDYVIDGDGFYRRHGHDLVSVLGWFVPEQDDLAAQRLIGSESPDLDGRTAIAVCPEDGDLLCGVLTARIVKEDTEIQWIDLAYSHCNHESEIWPHDRFRLARGPELRFEAEQYRAAISQRPSPERGSPPPG
jgi:hypothetical protein